MSYALAWLQLQRWLDPGYGLEMEVRQPFEKLALTASQEQEERAAEQQRFLAMQAKLKLLRAAEGGPEGNDRILDKITGALNISSTEYIDQ